MAWKGLIFCLVVLCNSLTMCDGNCYQMPNQIEVKDGNLINEVIKLGKAQ
ncbi:hypothetical protein lerEdw1_009997 [Lerista edwardsae]|nr:hypothetical protein lerEdw1_009997 [Lerista edwardsae]